MIVLRSASRKMMGLGVRERLRLLLTKMKLVQ